MKRLMQFLRSEDAATAVEYAVILALICVACISGVALVGQQTGASFASSAAQINSITGS